MWLIVVVASAACLLASLRANTVPSARELRPLVVEALPMLPSQALLLLCHLDNDPVIIILYINKYIKILKKGFFLSRDPCEESSGRADDGEYRRGAFRAGGAGR